MTKKKIRRKWIAVGFIAWFSLCMHSGFSQKVETLTNRNNILIGEQIQIKVKTSLPLNGPVLRQQLVVPDQVQHFDIVETGKADTSIFKDGSISIEQTVTVTSFDSGRWVFPSMPIQFSGAGQAPFVVQTDSFYVNVDYAPADGSNELRDIKPIIPVTIRNYFWVYVVGGALLLLLIVVLLYRYFKKKKKAQPLPPVSHLSAYDEAMEAFKKLSQLNLQDALETKKFHSGLADIFKNYLGRKQQQQLLNKTTDDLLINVSGVNMSPENIANLATALRCTDAVKFAKFVPLPDESEDCRQKLQKVIGKIETTK